MNEQQSSNYLLACPFCGGTPRMATEYDPDGVKWHYITCLQCGARIRGQWHSPGNDCPLLRAEVRDQWNRRASVEPKPQASKQEIARQLREWYESGWIRGNTLKQKQAELLWAAIGSLTADEPPAVDVAPIAKLTVRDGLVQRAGLYAPGLPDGDHDVYLEPIPAQPPSAWQPIETAPHDREVLFWVVPLSADETYRDTSGNPITSGEKPRMMFCRFGRWSSLSKAIYWADVPGSPTVTKSEEPEPEHVCDGGWACHFHDVKKAADETSAAAELRASPPPTDALTLEQLTAAIAYMGCDTDREYTPEAFARDLFAAARQSSTKSAVCEHDLQKPSHTVWVSDSGKVARCSACGQQWSPVETSERCDRPPPHNPGIPPTPRCRLLKGHEGPCDYPF